MNHEQHGIEKKKNKLTNKTKKWYLYVINVVEYSSLMKKQNTSVYCFVLKLISS